MSNPYLEVLQVAANILNAQKARFIPVRTWPTLPEDWDTLQDAGPEDPDAFARLLELSAQCTQARTELQEALMRPELIMLVMRADVETKFMACIWTLLMFNMPPSMLKPGKCSMRIGAILGTVDEVSQAFGELMMAFMAANAQNAPNPANS